MDELFDTVSGKKWKKFGTARRAGVLLPLFSVYSGNSTGIGDFGDLELVIDWCAGTGNSILQLLPMNAVGATFCPYDAISSFALETAYISLSAVPAARGEYLKSAINNLKKKFPAGNKYVNYGVKEAKEAILRDIYSEDGTNSACADAFKDFVKENSYWLDDFALFKVLKYCHGDRPWYEWEEPYRTREESALKGFRKEHPDDVKFQKWMQWVAYLQLKRAKKHAISQGVRICGDLPILISKDSADVWSHPEFFNLGFAAGAPPDMYCAKGQRWGMPTYNWEAIAQDKFRYLRSKLKFAQTFYDMLRVDHAVGFFRIWSIPDNESPENEGLNGAFDPRDENAWKEHGERILSVMNDSTGMLLIAEDLGIIPKVCPETLKEFGIPGNDVQRWTKDWVVSHDFLKPGEFRLISAAMLSTHDTTNWSAWWKYEAGTIDEALFIRKCADRHIDYSAVNTRLFDRSRAKHGRLRWLERVDSVDLLVSILCKPKEEVKDFIEMYENTYREKEKLWVAMKLNGAMREEPDSEIVAAVFKITLESRAIFCINTLIDYLYLADLFKADPYQYRINRPGTIDKTNWSLAMPISLEALLEHPVSSVIESMIRKTRSCPAVSPSTKS